MTVLKSIKAGGGGGVSDAAYGEDWDADTTHAPSRNAVYDILASLVPPPAPALDNISCADSGTAGKLSFGSSHSIATYSNVSTEAGGAAVDVNGTFPVSGQRLGIFNASTVINGVLNDDVAAHAYAYPANAFGNGNLGTLSLEVNGSVIHTTDLTTFGGPADSLNGNGSGFTTLSAATSVEFESGDPFDAFKYRTGNWTVAAADQRNGWNYVRILHSEGSVTTNYYEWVVDAVTTTTTYASTSVSGLSMAGSAYLSGAQYHTSGSATLNATISNHHRNTYSSSASAITFPTTTNCSVSSLAVNAIDASDWEAKTQVLAQTVTVSPDSGNRILDADLVITVNTDRTVQSDTTSSSISGGYELLYDSNISGASGQTDTAEPFVAEGYRLPSNFNIESTSYATGPGHGPVVWDSTISLVSATAGYSDGLLVYNDALRYPTQGPESGHFDTIANGPAGNPDYSSAAGNRVEDRYFYVGSGKQNFTLNVTCTNATFVSVATGPSGNNITMEILAPATTKDGGGTTEWKDAVTAYTDDASDGCYAATYGATIPTNWGITLGTKTTATSGSVIVARITGASGWTGYISNMTVTVL